MYPTSNVNGQQSAGQPIYYPANSSQPAYSQGYVNSQIGNQQTPQPMYFMPMIYSINGGQYAAYFQYAPVHNGESAKTQPNLDNLRVEIPSPVFARNETLPEDQLEETPDSTDDGSMSSTSSVEPAPEVLPAKTKEFLLAVEKARIAKSLAAMNIKETSESADKNEKIDPASTKMNELSVIEKYFEEQMKMQQKILDLLQPEPSDYSWKPTQPKSYTMALERFKAFKPEEPLAPEVSRKNTSMVFIYDIDDITQLSLKILKGVRIMFPDLKHVTKAIEGVFNHFMSNFFEFNQDYDYDATSMNVSDGYFGAKVNEYLEFKTRVLTSGPNIIYELCKACEEALKQQQEALNIKRKPSQNVEPHQVEEFQKLFDQLWQSSKQCLQAISDKSLKKTYENVVLCDMIGNGSAQLLLAGLTSEVPLENLYSSFLSSKESVLERIQRDYGDSCTLVVVTSNEKTIAAAEKKDIVVWPVEDEKSLDALYTAQKSHLLK